MMINKFLKTLDVLQMKLLMNQIEFSIIVKNLLQFSRHELLEYSFVSILEIVNDTLLLVNTIMKHDQIVIHNYVAEDLPLISCRRQQVQQILMNLITNSKDALNSKYKGHSEK